MREAGYPHEIAVAAIDESALDSETPEAYVCRLARDKCLAGAAQMSAASSDLEPVVLAADTAVVTASNQLLGKPPDSDSHFRMLRLLSATCHTVMTGWYVMCGEHRASGIEKTEVSMRELDDAEIRAYWETGEPRDKAGGYAIQGLASQFVTRIDGNYANVVGLPVSQCATALEELGIKASWK